MRYSSAVLLLLRMEVFAMTGGAHTVAIIVQTQLMIYLVAMMKLV